MSEFPQFTIKELIEAGVHFGHKTMRWNPKMDPFLYGSRDKIHIIDLQKTAPLLLSALKVIQQVVKNNGRILFVGTKRQASEIIANSAKRCGQYYINNRWLGGMLTNWETVSRSIKTLISLDKKLADQDYTDALTKKEVLNLSRQRDKLELSIGGIKDMGGRPDLIFIIDTNKENIAILEAKKLNIPVVAIIDSNSDPDPIDYPIPGNDDATRAIKLYCKLVSDAVLNGIQQSLIDAGVDLGESQELIDKMSDDVEDAKKVIREKTIKKKTVPARKSTSGSREKSTKPYHNKERNSATKEASNHAKIDAQDGKKSENDKTE